MILIPSIELGHGAVVAPLPTQKGSDQRFEVLAENPLEVARGLSDAGALFFHLVDFDAVAGEGEQNEIVSGFVEAGLPCEVAGGVTDSNRVERLIAAGADRVVADPAFLVDRDPAAALVERLGARLAVGLDIGGECVRTIGRREEATVGLDEALRALVDVGVRRVVLRVARADGTPDVEAIRTLLPRLDAEVFAAAAVRSKADLELLGGLADDGLAGLVLEEAARALLERAQ